MFFPPHGTSFFFYPPPCNVVKYKGEENRKLSRNLRIIYVLYIIVHILSRDRQTDFNCEVSRKAEADFDGF